LQKVQYGGGHHDGRVYDVPLLRRFQMRLSASEAALCGVK